MVAILGPRQSGKTTLARQFVPPDSPNYFDLEDPAGLARLEEPMVALKPLQGLVVIDEIQKKPELMAILRVLADREPLPARFLILGSADPRLVRHSSESLAGRVERVLIGGFRLGEVGFAAEGPHWLRGGFPLSFLASSDQDSLAWRRNFIQTLIERDLPQLGVSASPEILFRFWSMVAHYHGQIWNAAEPARSLGLGETTVRRYLDMLTGLFMIRQLSPWHANLKKRQVKSPKIYFRDTGLLHFFLGIRSPNDLLTHPKSGSSWEGYAIEEVLQTVEPEEAYFWATHNGAELDLLLIKKGRTFGVECKRADAPRLTPSMQIARKDLRLDHLVVLYPGDRRYSLADGITAVPFASLITEGPQAIESSQA